MAQPARKAQSVPIATGGQLQACYYGLSAIESQESRVTSIETDQLVANPIRICPLAIMAMLPVLAIATASRRDREGGCLESGGLFSML